MEAPFTSFDVYTLLLNYGELLNSQFTLTTIAIALAGFLTIYCIYYIFVHPLANIPGPCLAKVTNLWRYYHYLRGDFQLVQLELFQKYQTSALRIGPTSIVFSDTASYKTIHGYNPGLERGQFYQMIRFADRDGERSMFSAKTNALHREKRKKLVSVAFTPKAVHSYGPTIRKHVDIWLQEITRNIEASSHMLDVAYLNKALAFDAIYDILIGESPKFQGIWKTPRFQAAIKHKEWTNKQAFGWGCVPFISGFLELIGSVTKRQFYKQKFDCDGAPIMRTLIYWQQLTRCQHSLLPAAKSWDPSGIETVMHKLLALPATDSRKIKRDAEIITEVRTLAFAGPGTAAAALTCILFDLARNADWQQKIRCEAKAGYFDADDSHQSNAPLLTAFLKESLRMRPPDPLPFHLEVVSAGGVSIPGCETVLPKGTEVGALLYAVNRNKDVWGSDVDEFKPERWLIDDEQQLRAMREAFAVFGRGVRACPGERIALSLIQKCIHGILLKWQVSADPQALQGRCNFEMTFSSLVLAFEPL